jgi:hypothetical protein
MSAHRIRRCLQQLTETVKTGKASVLLPRGSLLFHGTTEKFSGRLKPGGYDGVAWFADVPAIAQLYIPRNDGSELHVRASSLVRPSKRRDVQAVQRAIGIEYDLDAVRWNSVNEAQSWPAPKGWNRLPDEAEVTTRLRASGFSEERGVFTVSIDARGNAIPSGALAKGKLVVVKTKRDMRIWRKSEGDGDLLDVQYHDIPGFRHAEANGFDGVLIDDFAQSEAWGNLGHLSLGLFGSAMRSTSQKVVPATYREFKHGRNGTPEWPKATPYFRSLQEQ